MGRNLRLDWRALALLGALLSVIIKWPALVYAMPTLFLPATIHATEMTTINETNSTAGIFMPVLNNPTSNNNNNNFTSAVLKTPSHNRFNNESDTKSKNRKSKSENENENEDQNEETNWKEPKDTLKSKELITNSDRNQSDSDTKEQVTKQNPSYERLPITVNSKNEQLHKTQRVKMLDMISNKRKRKKSNNEIYDDITTTTTSSNSIISHSDSSNKHSNRNLNNSNNLTSNKLNQNRTLNVAKNASNSVNIAISRSDSDISSTSPATATKNVLQDTAIEPIATASTSKHDDDINIDHKRNNDLASFKFSSSHRTAILSRTDRSIHQDPDTDRDDGVIYSSSSNSSTKKRRSSDDVSKPRRLNNSSNNQRNNYRSNINNRFFNNLDRNERSTVFQQMAPMRKIQLYIKNRFLQILPDGTVNGTYDDMSDYTILQRSSVDVGRIKIQSVATCLFLCMDSCGSIYSSKDFNDDCVFNENMEQHNYNTYSSTYNSNSRRVYYLALNRHGEPRRLQIPPTRSLGKLETYTNTIIEIVDQERVEQLIARTFGENRIKHGIRQLCDTGKPLIELIDTRNFKARPVCNPNAGNSNSSVSTNSNSNKNAMKPNHNNHNRKNNNSNNNNRNRSSNSHKNNSSSTSDQILLHNVPVANDKNSLADSISNNSNVNRTLDSVSNSSSTAPIISDNLTYNNSHNNISRSSSNKNNNSSNSSSSIPQQHNSPKKKKKRRKCPNEFEEGYDPNCQRGPQGMKKKKCRELLQQLKENGGQVDASLVNVTLICPPKRNNNKKNSGPNSKKRHQHNSHPKKGGSGGGGGRNRSNKKMNGNRSSPKNGKKQQNGVVKKSKKNGPKRQKKQPSTTIATTTTVTTTAATTSVSTTMQSLFFTTTNTPQMEVATTPIVALNHINLERIPNPSDRGEREQRNVHQSNEEKSELDEQEHEDSSEEEDQENDHQTDRENPHENSHKIDRKNDREKVLDNDPENEHENGREKDNENGAETDREKDGENENGNPNEQDQDDSDFSEDESYEDGDNNDTNQATDRNEVPQTQLTAGADYYYYDQSDYLPIGLWELFALLWIMRWFIRIRTNRV